MECDKNNVVLDRFQELVRNSGKTRQAIARDISCDTSTVTKQFNGDMKISVDYLVKYAKYFNVSADYLLGLSNAPTANKDVQDICDYTGLSLAAVENLHEWATELQDIPQEKYNEVINSFPDKKKDYMILGTELLKAHISIMNSDNKDFLFLLNKLLELDDYSFCNAVLTIREYILSTQETEDLDFFDIEKDMAEYSVYKITKKIIEFANNIKDDYLKYRGAENGNS